MVGPAINQTKNALMITLFAIMQKGETHYTIASIDAIIALLKKIHGISVKRRWTFQCMYDLIDAKLINRQSRYRQNEDGTIRQISSMIAFTMKGLRYMVKKRVKGAKKLLRRMLKWLKGKDNRFPHANTATINSEDPEIEENLKRLRRLVSDVG